VRRILSIVAFFVIAESGCNRSDGDRLTRVAVKLTEKIQELQPERTPLTGSFGITSSVNLDSRVRDRFKTDRYLAPLPIEIDANEGSTVRLRGSVDDAVLKQRAVEIAESTVGVEKVVDEIVVAK
jgi:hyperosmotically inducible periplasmic protein